MSDRTIHPARTLNGGVRPPGDKSLSHRAAMLAALGAGASRLENFATGADCHSTLACLAALGVPVAASPEAIEITGMGLRGLKAPSAALDAGNPGSTLRMLSGILAAQPFASEIAGDASLARRPMRRILDPLRAMGVAVSAADGDRPPLRFEAVPQLRAIEYKLPVASAQVKSCILLAGLYAAGTTTVHEPVPTRDHTETLLRALGAPVVSRAGAHSLAGPVESLPPLGTFRVPGDPSSAAFFLCAAACFPESELYVDEVSLNPTRSALLDVLARMGARPSVVSVEERAGELVGSLHLVGPEQRLTGTTIAGAEAAALIDEVPILAVLATQTRDGIVFDDVAELRVKESDRIAAIAENLRAMGAHCETSPTRLAVPGQQRLRGARLESHHDHRIAMAFAVAALLAEGETQIADPECASISFPAFYDELDRLAER